MKKQLIETDLASVNHVFAEIGFSISESCVIDRSKQFDAPIKTTTYPH
jgi:hypothetical protein